MSAKIVHEASTQRQQVRLRVPLLVRFEGKTYQAADWSMGGLRIEGVETPPDVGSPAALDLDFQFQGFGFDLDVAAIVRRATPEGEVAFEFTDLTPSKIELLQFIVGAYVSGELVQAGDLLAISKRENFVAARKQASAADAPQNNWVLIQRMVLLGLLWLLALTLVWVIVSNAFDRWFVVRADGVLTSPEARTIYAPGEGTIAAVNARPGTRVKPGQLLVTLDSTIETLRPVTANCDCVAGQTFVEVGGFVRKGAPLLSIAPAQGRVSGDFLVPLNQVQRLRTGDRVSVHLYEADRNVRGRVERVVLPTFAETNSFGRLGASAMALTAIVRIRFEDTLPVSVIGQPASAKINTFHPFG